MDSYESVLNRVRKTSAQLLAVSKSQSFDKIAALYARGQRDFGENYVQELVEKAKTAQEQGLTEIRWHLIGPLQTNKVKDVLPWVTMIHSVDSLRLAQILDKKWPETGRTEKLPILTQINIDHEDSKRGFLPEVIEDAVSTLETLQHIQWKGFMAIPKPDPATTARAFAKMRSLTERYRSRGATELSMGMSSDYAQALTFGATWVRVGSLLFGERSDFRTGGV